MVMLRVYPIFSQTHRQVILVTNGSYNGTTSRPEEKFPISESYLEAGVVCSLSWCKTNLTRVYGRDTYGQSGFERVYASICIYICLYIQLKKVPCSNPEKK